MTLYVAPLVDPLLLTNWLPDEDERIVREALRLIRRFLDDYSPYVALLRNFIELDGHIEGLDREFAARPAGLRTAQQIDVMMLEVNRLMMNFLASARAFLDITPRRLGAYATQTRLRFDAWRSVQYEASVSYRIFENLRNVSQHLDIPIRAYSAAQMRRDDGSVEVTQQLMIDRETFIEAGIQAPVRAELAALDGNIPVHGHLRRYFEGLGLLQLQIMRDVLPAYAPAAQTIERHVRAAGDPMAVPI